MPTTLIFLHIPKTGGQTLDHILRRRFPPENVFEVGSQSSIDHLGGLAEPEKRRIRYVTGHAPFGLHELFRGSAKYVTLLRNPVERAISEYYYVRRTVEHPFHNKLIALRMSLEDYVNSQIADGETNLQTRWLSGLVDLAEVAPPYGALPASAFSCAETNLRTHFAITGTTERFDETVLLLGRMLGSAPLFYVRKNVSPLGAMERQVAVRTRQFIEEHNQLDLKLWELASRRFGEALNAYGFASMEIRTFRFLNESHGLRRIRQISGKVRNGLASLGRRHRKEG